MKRARYCAKCQAVLIDPAKPCQRCGHLARRLSAIERFGVWFFSIIFGLMGIGWAAIELDRLRHPQAAEPAKAPAVVTAPQPTSPAPNPAPAPVQAKAQAPKPMPTTCDDSRLAVIWNAEAVIKEAVAPKPANFNSDSSSTLKLKECAWVVHGYVDTVNAFNAPTRVWYLAHVIREPGVRGFRYGKPFLGSEDESRQGLAELVRVYGQR